MILKYIASYFDTNEYMYIYILIYTNVYIQRYTYRINCDKGMTTFHSI